MSMPVVSQFTKWNSYMLLTLSLLHSERQTCFQTYNSNNALVKNFPSCVGQALKPPPLLSFYQLSSQSGPNGPEMDFSRTNLKKL